MAKQAKVTQAAKDPGELKSDKGYCEWENRWESFIYTIPGQNGIQLSYIIRIESELDYYQGAGGGFLMLPSLTR